MHIPDSLARLRREATPPSTLSGAAVYVRAATLRRQSGVRTLARVIPMAAAILGGVTLVIRGLRLLREPPPLPRRRRRRALRESLRPTYVQVNERVRYSAEFLRTTTGSGLELRRGRVVAERRVPNYPGDPTPRQVVTVRWDDDPEPHRLLHQALEPIGRVLTSQPS